jgi:hypothetical protein
MAFLSASRTVLLLSDDGVSVYRAKSGGADFVDTVHWDTVDFEESVSSLVKNRCGGQPVVILTDLVEQHYRKERIPSVSPLDRANLVKRRLSSAFPSYPIRSGLMLKEKPPAVEDQKPGSIYLFGALPLTDNVRKVLAAVRSSHASIAGFCLLPVEATTMVHALSKKVFKGGTGKSEWCLFLGQHHSGGLRQVVIKNGELALTRMTPIASAESDPDTWCSDLVTELKGTMSYLSRFGYTPDDGLSVIAIAPEQMQETLRGMIDFDCDLHVMTPRDAAGNLGIKLSGRGEGAQKFADILHVAWAGKKSKFLMPLKSPQIEGLNKPVQMATAATVLLMIGAAYTGYEGAIKTLSVIEMAGDIDNSRKELQAVEAELEEELQKKKDSGVDYMLVESAATVYNELEDKAMRPLPMFDVIGRSVGADLRLQSLEIKPVTLSDEEVAAAEAAAQAAESEPAEDDGGTPAAPPKQKQEYEIVIRLVFPPTLAPDIGVKKVGEIEAKLKASLPNHEVKIIKQVADLSYTGNFVGEVTSEKETDEKDKNLEAQIMIKGGLL